MSRILVSGLVNVETTCRIESFPIDYQPIDYAFFGVNMAVSGVGYNVAKAMTSLEDEVTITSMAGNDEVYELVEKRLEKIGVDAKIQTTLKQTPTSAVLYDNEGKRRIYCDLKDIQEQQYNYEDINLKQYDLAVVCNINFSRPLLKKAKEAGIKICSDVHVLSDIHDEYNEDFMKYSDILFLSNEAVIGKEKELIKKLADTYQNEIIVMGCGSAGAKMYVRADDKIYECESAKPEKIVNTVGAGDALFSAFVSMYARGEEPMECLRLAQKFAAHKIGFDGAAQGFMTLKELTNQNVI
ncbi:MAG: carbohydrate kinase family protein [Agathobacter sp.]|nr:carbohydrate kinase family protein [Agathobacter sp.]